MTESGWIAWLFDRGHGLQAVEGPRFQRFMREVVEQCTAGEPEKELELRTAALSRLNGDIRDIQQALAFLSVVGHATDLTTIDSFRDSRDERIRKAAEFCQFELRRQSANR